MINETSLVHRLAYHIGRRDGLGWPFNLIFRKDIDLMREAMNKIVETSYEKMRGSSQSTLNAPADILCSFCGKDHAKEQGYEQ